MKSDSVIKNVTEFEERACLLKYSLAAILRASVCKEPASLLTEAQRGH